MRTKIGCVAGFFIWILALVLFWIAAVHWIDDFSILASVAAIISVVLLFSGIMLHRYLERQVGEQEKLTTFVYALYVPAIIITFFGSIPGLVWVDNTSTNRYWQAELGETGIQQLDLVTLPSESFPVTTSSHFAHLSGHLAIKSSDCVFVISKVESESPWPFSLELPANIEKRSRDWGSGSIKETYSSVPLKAVIEIPDADISKPFKIYGYLDSIEAEYPVPGPGEYQYYDASGTVRSEEFSFWVIPRSLHDKVLAVQEATSTGKYRYLSFGFHAVCFVFLLVVLTGSRE